MPYVQKEVRDLLDQEIKVLADKISNNGYKTDPGVLNYTITKLILDLDIQPKYLNYNSIVGALECSKLELYRRLVAPYEDKKILENGDVY